MTQNFIESPSLGVQIGGSVEIGSFPTMNSALPEASSPQPTLESFVQARYPELASYTGLLLSNDISELMSQDDQTLLHEIGHAIITQEVGARVKKIHVGRQGNVLGYTEFEAQTNDQVMSIAAAGIIWNDGGDGGDRAMIEFLGGNVENYVNLARQRIFNQYSRDALCIAAHIAGKSFGATLQAGQISQILQYAKFIDGIRNNNLNEEWFKNSDTASDSNDREDTENKMPITVQVITHWGGVKEYRYITAAGEKRICHCPLCGANSLNEALAHTASCPNSPEIIDYYSSLSANQPSKENNGPGNNSGAEKAPGDDFEGQSNPRSVKNIMDF